MHIKKKKWPQKTNFRYPYEVDIKEAFQETVKNWRTGETVKRFSWSAMQNANIEDWCYHNLKGDFSSSGCRWWFEKRNDAVLFKLKWS